MSTSAQFINLAGLAAVVLYAVLGVLTILVWNPSAAMPALELSEIYRQVEAASETMGLGVVAAFGVMGIGLGLTAAVVFWRRKTDPPSLILAVYLTLLALAGPAYFWASFPFGMGLADTFAIGGGDHSRVGYLLVGASGLAFLALLPVLWRFVYRPPAG
ncbi:hypothetical protein V1639_13905 [Pseudarthrobacter sp. J75]|uniref:hypothetical protein n=1 Tax=unclassified Pseudarthrobacter TaxID=2647000 RepID=UPI002E824A32|nr:MULTISPECIES: hypothetical protein [unclassified Pseudarthrobacter]MEE2524599.1 hypothetical protein [Pseudarthrobacter sp. J47]MEE2530116.1 hypothetical protein [Pseudarthrobacter sp. J75]MEE2570402.1 hypothetical protein [Pseudarthrobacter sp. J64]